MTEEIVLCPLGRGRFIEECSLRFGRAGGVE